MSTAARSPRAVFTLGRAIFKKQLTLMFRYPINLFSGLLTMYIFFAMIFFGGQAVAGQALAENLEGIIVGFFLWSMAWSAFADLTWNVTREAQWGTLEQLYMTTYGFEVVMLVLDVVTIVPVVILGLLSVVGLGFVFGGLAIVYKRIENVFQILTFAFVGLIGAPVDAVPALKALPLTQSSYLLSQAMEDGVRLWAFPASELGILVVVSVGYCLAGVLFFRVAQHRARKLGVLAHY